MQKRLDPTAGRRKKILLRTIISLKEVKLTGLESLKHLISNSNRLRTSEDARLEIVTYVEEKFGLRMRDFKTDSRFFWGSDSSDVCGQLSLVGQRKVVIKSARWVCFADTAASSGKRIEKKESRRNQRVVQKEPRARKNVPKAHAKATRRKWDKLIMMTWRRFTKN